MNNNQQTQSTTPPKKMGTGTKIVIGIIIAIFIIGVVNSEDSDSTAQNSLDNTSNEESANVTSSYTDTFQTTSPSANESDPAQTQPVNTDSKIEYDIISSYVKAGINLFNDIWFQSFLTLKNTGDTNIYIGSAVLDIENSSGKLVKHISDAHVFPQIISPGETALIYYDGFLDSEQAIGEYTIVPTIDIKKATVGMIRLEVTESSIYENILEKIEVSGRIKNTSGKTRSLCKIAVILYDQNDTPIDAFYRFTDEITPDQIIGFEADNSWHHTDITLNDVHRYEIFVFESQYQK